TSHESPFAGRRARGRDLHIVIPRSPFILPRTATKRVACAAFAPHTFQGKTPWEECEMAEKDLRRAADEAEARKAREAAAPHPVSEADLADVIDVDAVDEYVAATGEYPRSSDLAEGDLVDEGFSTNASVEGLGANIHAMPGKRKDERA